MTLFPVQCAALVELADHGGVLLQAGVGKGKTLISALAATVTGAERPLLVVPANLKQKTIRDFRELARDWRVAPIRIESYEQLSRAAGAQILATYRPDLLILDECHKAKNPAAAVTRKIRRYVRETRAAGVLLRVLDMSGTLGKRSILDFADLARWAQPNHCPLPDNHAELLNWAAAVDEKVAESQRAEPGALVLLGGDGTTPLEMARTGLQSRIFSTPGYIATSSNEVANCSLIVQCHQVNVSREVDDAFRTIKNWQTPCGLDIASGIEMWRHCRELATDFYYRWKVPPPLEWMAKRRAWCKAVRETIQHNRRGLDSEDDVRREVLREGEKHPLWRVWDDWREIKPTFELETEPVWIGTHCLDFVSAWAARNVGLIWTEWPIVGQRLAKALGVEYYGREGLNSAGRAIDAPGVEDGSRCAVASIKANGTGRNLQGIWSRALVTSAPPTGTECEQMIGRIHRTGQVADEVVFDFMIACREQWNGFLQSMRDAQFHSSVLGSQMKMLASGKSADIVIPEFNETGGAWASPRKD